MLIVDPVKRITVAEIRQLPWFQKGLPPYLQPLPPTPAAESSGFDFGMSSVGSSEQDKKGEGGVGEVDENNVAPDIGIVEDRILAELADKMVGFSPEELRERLLEPEENQVKVAYHLVRDHQRMLEMTHLDQNKEMEGFLAQSPPAWNAGLDDVMGRSTSIRRKGRGERTPREKKQGGVQYGAENVGLGDESMMSEQDAGNVTDEMAIESFASEDEGMNSATDEDETGLFTEDDEMEEGSQSQSVGIAILEPSIPGMRMDETPSSETVPSSTISITASSKRARNRWHFGIRSRSPPMEIMLELYRTLQVLGMEWRAKPSDVKEPEEEGGEANEKGNGRNHEDQGPGEELYFIETRWKVDGIIVRMNLQLYRVDETNYLVDFRNVGYVRLNKDQDIQLESNVVSPVKTPEISESGLDQATIHEALDRAYKSSEQNTEPGSSSGARKGSNQSQQATDTAAEGRKEVCSPFLFLECATRLIVELAGGG